MGGRGSSRGTGGSGSRIEVPEGKRRLGSGGRRKKLKGEAGSPYGTERPGLPLRPAGSSQGTDGEQ